MKLSDQVSEAYFGAKGERFARKTRERIHWICSKVEGEQVLDIGCSQGIKGILLAREGKQVIGIDIDEESITYANHALAKEIDSIKEKVEYRLCSIFDFETDKKFDTVILAEVMEHFASSKSLLERVFELLNPSGTLVVTVPFGINDFIDHKKTYYLTGLLDEIEPSFEVKEIKFFGKWIGLVAFKREEPGEFESILNRELIKQLEDNFYAVERALIDDNEFKADQIKKFNVQLTDSRQTVNQLSQENQKLKMDQELLKAQKLQIEQQNKELLERNERLENELNKLTTRNRLLEVEHREDKELFDRYERLKSEINELKERNRHLENENEQLKMEQAKLIETDKSVSHYKEKISELEKIIEAKNKEIMDRLDSEEATLKKFKETVLEMNKLEAKLANISKKYELLSNAKLGRLTLKYWKFRKRIPEDF